MAFFSNFYFYEFYGIYSILAQYMFIIHNKQTCFGLCCIKSFILMWYDQKFFKVIILNWIYLIILNWFSLHCFNQSPTVQGGCFLKSKFNHVNLFQNLSMLLGHLLGNTYILGLKSPSKSDCFHSSCSSIFPSSPSILGLALFSSWTLLNHSTFPHTTKALDMNVLSL